MSVQRSVRATYLIPVDLASGAFEFDGTKTVQDKEIQLPSYDYDAWTINLASINPNVVDRRALISIGEAPGDAVYFAAIQIETLLVQSVPDYAGAIPFRRATSKLFLRHTPITGAVAGLTNLSYRVTLWRYVVPAK